MSYVYRNCNGEAIQTLRDCRSATARAGVGQKESAIGQRTTFSDLVSQTGKVEAFLHVL